MAGHFLQYLPEADRTEVAQTGVAQMGADRTEADQMVVDRTEADQMVVAYWEIRASYPVG